MKQHKHWWSITIIGLVCAVLVIPAIIWWDDLLSLIERIWFSAHFFGQKQAFRLYSTPIGDDFAIQVMLPPGYQTELEKSYPVIYVLDGDSDARAMAGAAASLGIEAIIVGVGYGSDQEDARERDYTPFQAAEIDWAPSGGGAAFYAFMVNDLIPYMDMHYATRGNGQRILAGHSLAGLATIYASLQSEDPPTFDGYIAASPTLTLSDSKIFEIEAASARKRNTMPALLYMSMGVKEHADMITTMSEMAQTLRSRNHAGLTVYDQVHDGRGHGGNNWISYQDGLRWLNEQDFFSASPTR